MPCLNRWELVLAKLSYSQIDHHVDSTVGSLQTTLDTVAPLKKMTDKRKSAPWYNAWTLKLKQINRELERNLAHHQIGSPASLKIYKKAFCTARADYNLALTEYNKK